MDVFVTWPEEDGLDVFTVPGSGKYGMDVFMTWPAEDGLDVFAVPGSGKDTPKPLDGRKVSRCNDNAAKSKSNSNRFAEGASKSCAGRLRCSTVNDCEEGKLLHINIDVISQVKIGNQCPVAAGYQSNHGIVKKTEEESVR
jgi:hypothetical protein